MIPYGRQDISEDDIQAVVAALKSDFIAQGPAVAAFETAVAQKVGARHGIAVNSATSALHIACLALGVGPGDRVWTSPITFVASANAALYCCARVDFVDIDPVRWTMSVDALEQKLKAARKNNTLPKVVIPVHFMGEPCDMAAIAALAKEYDFKVVEDAAHAIGGRYGSNPIGACTHSDITVFSFHPVKVITTGEGGMAVTNDAGLARTLNRLRSHGLTREAGEMQGPSHGGWYYQQLELGFNYRMTDIQAALGLSQLKRLGEFVARRHDLADRYDAILENLPLQLPVRDPGNYSGLHLYPVVLKHHDRRAVYDHMQAAGIGVNVHYIPVHTQPYYQRLGFRVGDFPNAEQYYERALTLPLYPALSEAEQDQVVAALTKALS
jgi:UDP-4-amino-4,6-dideoxy-N-acetyl-beta-L-altrosamine transaminase